MKVEEKLEILHHYDFQCHVSIIDQPAINEGCAHFICFHHHAIDYF